MSIISFRKPHTIRSYASEPVTVRPATPADAAQLRRLADRDSARLPAEPLLVGETAGELRAAVGLDGSPAIADPFRHTAEVVALLEARAAQLRRARGRPRVIARSPARASGGAALRRRTA